MKLIPFSFPLPQLRRAIGFMFNIVAPVFAVVAAIVGIAMILIVPRSFIVGEGVMRNRGRFYNSIYSSSGSLEWRLLDARKGTGPLPVGWFYVEFMPRPAKTGRFGFELWQAKGPYLDLAAVAPDWAVIVGCASIFIGCYLRSRRWLRQVQRRWRGLCVVCGYDLRATPGRCPECGEVPKTRTVAIGDSRVSRVLLLGHRRRARP